MNREFLDLYNQELTYLREQGAAFAEAYPAVAERLGGLLAMSTYLATVDSLEPAAANRDLPIEIHHGNADPVVPEALGQAARDRLEALGYPVRYRQYPMAHAVCPQQVADIGPWIAARLGR